MDDGREVKSSPYLSISGLHSFDHDVPLQLSLRHGLGIQASLWGLVQSLVIVCHAEQAKHPLPTSTISQLLTQAPTFGTWEKARLPQSLCLPDR